MKGEDLKQLRDRLREHSLRVTPQRIAVYDAVMASGSHPNADAVYRIVHRKHPNISFDTVHRTLSTFVTIGLLHVVEGYGEPKRYDPNIGGHHHFRCVKCGRIVDFVSRQYDNLRIPREIEDRFQVLGRKVLLEGLCTECRGTE